MDLEMKYNLGFHPAQWNFLPAFNIWKNFKRQFCQPILKSFIISWENNKKENLQSWKLLEF